MIAPDRKLCPALVVLVDEARRDLGLSGAECHEALRRHVPRDFAVRALRTEIVEAIVEHLVEHSIVLSDAAREQLGELESDERDE